jgi:NAD(P)-dependent dehydrogenase (short-subunit alcohol dehydrogenase family)
VTVTDLTILITGAGSGIGHGLAGRFRADGANVVGCDLEPQLAGCDEVCDLSMAADVRDPAQLAAVVATATEKFGAVDGLIANAGLGRRATIAGAEWADLADVIDVNLLGVMHSVRAVLPQMLERGTGRIAVVVSRNAEFCPPKLGAYNVSKAGVIALTRTLAHELRKTDVLVNNLIPGPTLTTMNPNGTLETDACYPTARMLMTLPAGGPSGRTFYEEADYPMWSRFSSEGTAGVVHEHELAQPPRPTT